MGADFPEGKPYRLGARRYGSTYRRNSDAGDILLGIFGCLLILVMIAGWVTALYFLIHGVWIRELWEVVTGGVIIVVLLVIRAILAAIGK